MGILLHSKREYIYRPLLLLKNEINKGENIYMNEINISIKRKTIEDHRLRQFIDIHTSYPYINITSKEEILHVPVIEVEIFSTEKNNVDDIERISKSFVKALRNKWRIRL